ncbi:serine protease [Patescibacteria group bacterium]
MISKNIFKIIAIFVLGMIGGIFSDQILWPYFVEKPLFSQYRLEQNPIYVTEIKEISIQENVALKNAIEKVEKAIIGVKTETKESEILEGSGLIVASDGLVVTLAELVPQGSDFSFFVDGKGANFQILKRDLENNLALIKIEEKNLPTVSFVDLERVGLGERVFLVGVVFEEGLPQKMVNEGIVKIFDEDFIKTNIFEKDVLKGSPLFNIDGEVLGLNMIDKEGKVIAVFVSKIKEFVGF